MINNLKDTLLITKNFISFAPNIYLKFGRMREICGPSKICIAMFIGAKSTGLIVWIHPNWEEFIMNTDSISSISD